ncbi:site-specific DNA-methyltransferase [Methylovorus sp. MP688]|nr:site-specific DNA-methyltransferase [Methylovorus sp. MP688]
MGHKGKMLPILGDVLLHYANGAAKIADPFCGSAAVSWFLAENTDKEIISGDIQSFAVARAKAIVERTASLDPESMIKSWFAKATTVVDQVAGHFPNNLRSIEPNLTEPKQIKQVVTQSRSFCSEVLPVVFSDLKGAWPISKAYGGHYYSPVQALVFDALRQSLPSEPDKRKIALAALVEAVSRAAAAPGHTAQPFQPTSSSAKYIIEAWKRNPWNLVRDAVEEIAKRSAIVKGKGVVGDFRKTIGRLNEGDLVFADPPYSGVHYSRFYHALETITRGVEFEPEGKGRYPSIVDRPSSAFSKRTTSPEAARQLLDICSEKKLILILTFPTKGASNGLDASDFIDYGRTLFSDVHVEETISDFSTLGGNKKHRQARQLCNESIISFIP